MTRHSKLSALKAKSLLTGLMLLTNSRVVGAMLRIMAKFVNI